MRENEKFVVGGLVALLLLLWLGFLVHSDPQFPGSFVGTLVGIAAATFMAGPYLYLVIKRIKPLKTWATRHVSMRTLLAWHIYAGVLGPILAVIHSAHRFDSILGSILLPFVLLIVVSGFVGRYLLSQVSTEIRDKQQLLAGLRSEYMQIQQALAVSGQDSAAPVSRNLGIMAATGLTSSWRLLANEAGPRLRLIQIVDAMSDVELAIRAHDTFKSWFKRWHKFHITLSLILLGLISFHIFAELYIGLRWL